MNFQAFWDWLSEQPHTLPTHGSQNQGLAVDPAEIEFENALAEQEGLNAGDLLPLPQPGRFSIQAHTPHSGHIRVPSGRYHPFDLAAAQATWHRFQGLRQTIAKLTADGHHPATPFPHQRTSSYIAPTNRHQPYPQNWLDCPAPYPSPCYIAAAARIFCSTHPHAHALYPCS